MEPRGRARRWWRSYRRRLHNPQGSDGVLVRAGRGAIAWRAARRPAETWTGDWVAGALREDARQLDQMLARSRRGERHVRLSGARFKRASFGVQILEDGGISYQTIANDLRSIAKMVDSMYDLDTPAKND